jgi:hypothetical protein
MSRDAVCMRESGVKSGVLMLLLGQPAGGSSMDKLSRQVFDSAKQGNVAALLAALKVSIRAIWVPASLRALTILLSDGELPPP